MFRYLLICLILFTGSAHAADDDFDAVKKAAEQGDADAQNNLGVMYIRGEGVTQDSAEAGQWYRQAAEQGHARAQYNLGVMYIRGEGVTQDSAEAARWYRQARNKTMPVRSTISVSCTPMAMACPRMMPRPCAGTVRPRNRDMLVRSTISVSCTPMAMVWPEDDAEAVRWSRQAAEQGDADAQFMLGLMYTMGEGVPEDDIQAYAWISIAAAQGVENAKIAKEMFTGKMTSAEIAEAQKLSRKYREAFGPGLNTQ